MIVLTPSELKAGDLVVGYKHISVSEFAPVVWRLVEFRDGLWMGRVGKQTTLDRICANSGPYVFQVERADERTDLYRLLGVER